MSGVGPPRWCDIRMVDDVLVLAHYSYSDVDDKHIVTMTFKCFGAEFSGQLQFDTAPTQAEFDALLDAGEHVRALFETAEQLGSAPLPLKLAEESALEAAPAPDAPKVLTLDMQRVQTGVAPLVAGMLRNPGFYVAGDTLMPEFAMPLWSSGGKVFTMIPDHELEATRFRKELTLNGPILPGGKDGSFALLRH